MLALGIVGTGIAYVLYYALLSGAGASHAILVTYLVPAIALVYGAIFLGEAVTAAAVARSRARARRGGARDGSAQMAGPPPHRGERRVLTRRYVPLLLTLSLIWGASYLFIKEAVQDIPPATTMFIRLLVASLLLHAFLYVTRGRSVTAELRAAWRPGLVLGVVNGALPFTLIAWGEQHIASGVAAIGNSAVPIFNAALAVWLLPSERVSGTRLFGLLLGLAGVGVLAGLNPGGGDSLALIGTLAVIGSSVSYAVAGLYGQKRVASVSGPVLAASSTMFGALV